jgi:hypothetical protein
VTGPIAPCAGCGLRDELCRCLEEQAAACARLVDADPNVLKAARVAKAQAVYAARERLAARRARKEEA